MPEKEKVIYVRLDNATYESLSLLMKKRKKRGESANLSDVVREILQQATGNIDGERPVKYRDLEENIKQYNRGLDRVLKLWFKSSRVTLTILLTFINKMAETMGGKKVQEMLDDGRKQAVAILKEKDTED